MLAGSSRTARNHGERRMPQRCAQLFARAGRVTNLQPRDRGDPDKPSLDPRRPLRRIRAGGESDQSRLVDQPVRHRHARDMTAGSSRSAKTSANWAKSCVVTVEPAEAASCASRRRTYSLRDRPRRLARASTAATTSSGTSRISRSVVAPPVISHDSAPQHQADPALRR